MASVGSVQCYGGSFFVVVMLGGREGGREAGLGCYRREAPITFWKKQCNAMRLHACMQACTGTSQLV